MSLFSSLSLDHWSYCCVKYISICANQYGQSRQSQLFPNYLIPRYVFLRYVIPLQITPLLRSHDLNMCWPPSPGLCKKDLLQLQDTVETCMGKGTATHFSGMHRGWARPPKANKCCRTCYHTQGTFYCEACAGSNLE